jgi:hypothetical protein
LGEVGQEPDEAVLQAEAEDSDEVKEQKKVTRLKIHPVLLAEAGRLEDMLEEVVPSKVH